MRRFNLPTQVHQKETPGPYHVNSTTSRSALPRDSSYQISQLRWRQSDRLALMFASVIDTQLLYDQSYTPCAQFILQYRETQVSQTWWRVLEKGTKPVWYSSITSAVTFKQEFTIKYFFPAFHRNILSSSFVFFTTPRQQYLARTPNSEVPLIHQDPSWYPHQPLRPRCRLWICYFTKKLTCKGVKKIKTYWVTPCSCWN